MWVSCVGARTISSANPPSPMLAMTRSPTANPSMSAPTSVTSPAISLPGTKGNGGRIWYRPCTKRAST